MLASPTALGLLAGLALGFAGAFGGFPAFIIVLVLGVVGLGVGRYLDGQLDLSALTGHSPDRDRDLR
jgi:ribose/xylose/arabinose/galactoside ABC-type transport system permease subunit